ncbi:hypothetical protein B566_EDAN010802 [Ephemera danica]|nr:hypothetical protein B566_EDAN010802 [Ephemera danica]
MHSQSSKSTSGGNSNSTTAGGKRKRSWSRAVFSNLQRKGLEKRFQLQKYITKPDRRQLAATLGLTDAQVKVWFQNRRMKWRHSKEAKQQQQAATASVTVQQPADSRGPTLLTGDEERRAADSTQRDGVTSDDSDIDIEVDS